MLNAWDCLYDAGLNVERAYEMKELRGRQQESKAIHFHHCAVGRGAKWKCRISEEGVYNLVE
jgi:hypothetical protein